MKRTSPALAGVLAVLGFLLVTSVNSARADRRASEPRKLELIRIIEARRSQVGDLDAAVAELRGQVAGAERVEARKSAAIATATETATRLAIAAGTVAVRGRGVQVRLADSDREARSPDDASAGRIHDVDVQLVVNALLAAGAEALAINGNRLVATTAIRSAGDTLVVNFRPLRPPYRIDAIGADLAKFNDSEIAERFRRWEKLFGLSYAASRQDKLTVPGFTGRVAIDTAKPAPKATG